MYNDADIEQNEAIRNAPKKPAGKVHKRHIEMQDSNYEWRSIGLQEVEQGSKGYWYMAGRDREIAPAGTTDWYDGYRFAKEENDE